MLLGQEMLATAVIAHGLSHHQVLSRLPIEAGPMPETQLEMFARDASRRVLEVASEGAYTAFIAKTAKVEKTPTDANGFVIVKPPADELSALFPNEHGDRRRNWLFDQINWDVNTALDDASTKSGPEREHRHQQLYSRFTTMVSSDRYSDYLHASYVADE